MGEQFSRRGAMALIGGGAVVATSWTSSAGAAAAMASQPSLLPFEAEALAWLRRNAKPLPTPDASSADLQPLVAALGQAQVIGIGEASNGGHEDQAFKAALIRALVVGGGVQVLALDCNRRPGGLLDRYVRGGGGDPVETLRQPGLLPGLQSEEFLGLLTWLRAWNAAGSRPVRIIGIDVQGLGADAWEAYRWLYEANPNAARAFEAPLAPLFRNERLRDGATSDLLRTLSPSQQSQVSVALERLRATILNTNRGGQESAAAAALSARQAMQIARDDAGLPGQQQNGAGQSGRNLLMAENLLKLSEGARTVYWSHNLQVAAGGSVGASLRRRLGRNYRAVAFEYDRGSIFVRGPGTAAAPAGGPWQIMERPPLPGGLGAMLARTELEQFWVELSSPGAAPPAAWLAHPYPHDRQGAGPPTALALSGNVDLLVHFRRMTPLRLLQFVPRR